MTAVEFRARSNEELQENLKELKESLFGLRFQQILGQLEDVTQLKKAKKDIARIQTVLKERELQIR